jgi:hypothetical protein
MTSFWREHLEREPDLGPHLALLAQKFIRTGAVPKSFTFHPGPGQPAIRRALEFLFGGGRWADGKLVVQLPERLRTAEALQGLADHLGVAPAAAPEGSGEAALATALLRQKLLHPGCARLLDVLGRSDDLARLFRGQSRAEALLDGLLRAVERLRDNRAAITLSQLGADALQDSKALRSGALRKLLVVLLVIEAEAEDDDPAQVLARFGVIDNPYTTLALLYGPVAYSDGDGRLWDWPTQLHGAGQAAALTWEQVQGMRAIHLLSSVTGVITSENAAPFHRLVEQRSPAVCVYTGGYPNSAVMRVLRLLAEAGLRARHWGDTDLDGLRIAECVSRAIPVELDVEDGATCAGRLIPLDDVQRIRAAAFLAAHPDFVYRDALAATLRHGWLEQEQSQPGMRE